MNKIKASKLWKIIRNSMSWIINVLTIVVSTLIAFLIAEVFLRIIGVGYGNAPLERSHIYHHMHPINYQFLMHNPNGEYGGFHVYYDNLGFRVKDEASQTNELIDEEKAIIFMGDSFTEGNQVPYDETFVSLVSERLQVPSVNFGVSSYSPLMYELQIKNIVSQFNANTVVLQIYSNDFSDDRAYFKYAVLKNFEIIGIDGGENNVIVTFLRKSYLARFIRKNQLLLQEILTNPNDTNEVPYSAFDYEQGVTDEDLLNTVNILRRIDSYLDEKNKKLYVFLIPSKTLSMAEECCLRDNLYTRFYSALDEVEIDTIDVRSYFEQSNDQNELFFNKDIHLTSKGHMAVASSIVSYLSNK